MNENSNEGSYWLLQTGAIMVTSVDGYHDITRATILRDDGTDWLKSPKDPAELVQAFRNQWEVVREFADLNGLLLDKINALGNEPEHWELFKQSWKIEIVLLCENVFATPTKIYNARQRGVNEANLRDRFINKVRQSDLTEILSRKRHAYEIVLEYPFIREFIADHQSGKKSDREWADAILSFRKKYLNEETLLISRAMKIRTKTYASQSPAGLDPGKYGDKRGAVNTIGIDAFIYLREQLWNGTFYCSKKTFSESADATLYYHTGQSMLDDLRKLQKYPANAEPRLSDAGPEPPWYHQKVMTADEFFVQYRKELGQWLAQLTERSRKGIASEIFMQYAFALSPREKGTDAERAFYTSRMENDTEPASYNTYQGRVRDGGYLAVRLFDELFFNARLGLAFVGEAQLNDHVYVQALRNGTRIFITFPEDYREKVKINPTIDDQILISLLLETLQDSHWLFSILDA